MSESEPLWFVSPPELTQTLSEDTSHVDCHPNRLRTLADVMLRVLCRAEAVSRVKTSQLTHAVKWPKASTATIPGQTRSMSNVHTLK
jgi:hypothetical protein